jgi:hypothetical protein
VGENAGSCGASGARVYIKWVGGKGGRRIGVGLKLQVAMLVRGRGRPVWEVYSKSQRKEWHGVRVGLEDALGGGDLQAATRKLEDTGEAREAGEKGKKRATMAGSRDRGVERDEAGVVGRSWLEGRATRRTMQGQVARAVDGQSEPVRTVDHGAGGRVAA